MKISSTMDLTQLAERMDTAVTLDEAAKMRELLVEQFGGQDMAELLGNPA